MKNVIVVKELKMVKSPNDASIIISEAFDLRDMGESLAGLTIDKEEIQIDGGKSYLVLTCIKNEPRQKSPINDEILNRLIPKRNH